MSNLEHMNLENNWKDKSLENLEKDIWEEAGPDDTGLVQRVTALRKVPLRDFSTEDLRRVIGQQFSLDYLIPLALETLRENLFAEGDLYEGDLLERVLNVRPEFWKENGHYWVALDELIQHRLDEIKEMGLDTSKFYGVKG